MYTFVKILLNLFIVLFFVTAFVTMVILGIAYIRTQNSVFKLTREMNRKDQPVEKPQIIKKQPAAPKEPIHYTWKGYLRLCIFFLSIGYIIYMLFS